MAREAFEGCALWVAILCCTKMYKIIEPKVLATKILRDGDLVEVDANRGVVKIINKK